MIAYSQNSGHYSFITILKNEGKEDHQALEDMQPTIFVLTRMFLDVDGSQ